LVFVRSAAGTDERIDRTMAFDDAGSVGVRGGHGAPIVVELRGQDRGRFAFERSLADGDIEALAAAAIGDGHYRREFVSADYCRIGCEGHKWGLLVLNGGTRRVGVPILIGLAAYPVCRVFTGIGS